MAETLASQRDAAGQVAERTADRDRMWRLSTDIMLVARFDATIVAVNPAWTTLLAGTRRNSSAGSFLDLVHPDDLAATLLKAGRLSEGVTTLRFENRYRHKDGTTAGSHGRRCPRSEFIHAVGRDITAREAAGGGAACCRGGAAPVAEDGGGRPAHGRHRARLQQPADRDRRLPRHAADARHAGAASRPSIATSRRRRRPPTAPRP